METNYDICGEGLHQNSHQAVQSYPFGDNPEELRKIIKMAEVKVIRLKELYERITGTRYKG